MFFKQMSQVATIIAGILLFILDANANHPRLDTIRERLANRDFPSTFDAWGGLGWVHTYVEPGTMSDEEIIALADLQFTNKWGGVDWVPTLNGELRQIGDLDRGMLDQGIVHSYNPNMVFLKAINIRSDDGSYFPEDSPYWIRDPDGNRVLTYPNGNSYLLDYTHPDVQDFRIQQAVAVAESGLFDGIMYDWWKGDGQALRGWYNGKRIYYRTYEEERIGRENIIRGIRESVHPDFLILVNTNEHRLNVRHNYPYINGMYLETAPNDGIGYSPGKIRYIEASLLWASQNMREPRINCLEARTTVDKSVANGPEVRRWMRLFTTMGLTHSNGFVLYAILPGHNHLWYDFWNAPLGDPISPIAQPLENQERYGCFIREYTNGWAVYNRSSVAQTVVLPEVTAAVSTGQYDYSHEVPSMDGEIFLRTHPTHLHPRNLLTTSWGALKLQ